MAPQRPITSAWKPRVRHRSLDRIVLMSGILLRVFAASPVGDRPEVSLPGHPPSGSPSRRREVPPLGQRYFAGFLIATAPPPGAGFDLAPASILE
jgi:hypothetical protein